MLFKRPKLNGATLRGCFEMNQRTPAPGTLIPRSDFSFRGTHRPEGSLGRGNRKCKQWRPGRLRSVTNPENERPDPDVGASRIWAWVPRYRVQPRAGPPTPTPGLCGRGQLGSGLGVHHLPPSKHRSDGDFKPGTHPAGKGKDAQHSSHGDATNGSGRPRGF